MATQPAALPEWASQDQNDPITGVPNKVEPTASFKLSGVLRNEAILRAYLNYELDNISDWVTYLNDAMPAGQDPISGTSTVITIPTQNDNTYQVSVTPLADQGTTRMWVSAKTTTDFTISTNAALAISVDWVVVNK